MSTDRTSENAAALPVSASLSVNRQGDAWRLVCAGDWDVTGVAKVDLELRALAEEHHPDLVMDTSGVSGFDTAGAWLVERLRASAANKGRQFQHIDTDSKRAELVRVVRPDEGYYTEKPAKPRITLGGIFGALGEKTVNAGNDFLSAAYLIGASIRGPQMKAGKRGAIRIKSIISQIDKMGLQAVPVIAVMSFLIGGIIAQQGANQLKQFGEELLTVDLVGILHFREISVLLTAIMVAGRTGSAMTAELGTMRMREEVDALQVIGLNPVGVLIFPRLVALIIVLPILTLLSNVTGMLGAIVVSDLYVGITPSQFLTVLQADIPFKHINVGLIKAPFMALIIGLAAAVEGMKVGGSSESLGRHTTSAVVTSIFAVIVVDGIFAVFFAAIGY